MSKGLQNRSLGASRRKPVSLSSETLVKISFFQPDQTMPMVIQPAVDGVDIVDWAANNRPFIESSLAKYGSILFRDFAVPDIACFTRFTQAISTELLEYKERSSPRHQVQDKVYTSTDHPSDQIIFLHNENSYAHKWPQKIFFHCVTPPETGGETPIADCRKIFNRIDRQIKDRFMDKKILYMRNFGSGMGLDWQVVFQTDNKASVEEYCRNTGYDFEWREGDRLRTRRLGLAAIKHPKTGEMTWFNHGTFFHISTLEPTLRDVLLSQFELEDLPNNTYYGDGTSIELEVLDALRDAYRQETVTFPWQKGDILLLDNMLVAHGRNQYTGSRFIAVGMSEVIGPEDLS